MWLTEITITKTINNKIEISNKVGCKALIDSMRISEINN